MDRTKQQGPKVVIKNYLYEYEMDPTISLDYFCMANTNINRQVSSGKHYGVKVYHIQIDSNSQNECVRYLETR